MSGFKNKLYAGFLCAFLLSAVTGLTSYLSFKKQADLSEWVNHSYKVENATRTIQQLMMDLETERRGFRIANEKRFLQPYYQEIPHIGPAIEELGKLVSDNPGQISKVVLLERNINQLLRFWKYNDDDARVYSRAQVALITENEKRQMDEVRNNINGILLAENILLTERNIDNNRSIKLAAWVSLSDTGLTLAIISILVVLIVREFRKRRATIEKLVQSNVELTNRKMKLRSAEVELKQSNEQLQKIMDNSLDVICTIDGEGKFIMVSRACKTTWGYEPEELYGKPYIEMVLEEDVPATSGEAIKVMNGTDAASFANRYIRKDGSIVPMIWSAKWSAGEQTMFCIAQDATEKERFEQQLEAERKRYADLFLQAPSPICILSGPDHVFEMANPLYLQLTGKKNIIGKTAFEVFPELEEQGFSGLLEHVYKTGTPFLANEVLMQIDKDGDGKLIDYYLNFIYQPYKNNNGETGGIFFFANIVTEQVLARKKIEQNGKYFRALVENNFDIIVLLDESGNVTYQSPATERILGYTPGELAGKNASRFFHPDEMADVFGRMETALKNPGKPVYTTNRILHKDGHYIWTEGTTTNLLEDENVKAYVGNFRDITERKLGEEKIVTANRLYAFISQINQIIAQVRDEETLFNEACRIAIDIGKFKMAWVGIADKEHKTINLVAGRGIPAEDIRLFTDVYYPDNGPQDRAVRTGSYYVCNDVENDLESVGWKPYASAHALQSCMVLPLKRAGVVIGTLNLYSSTLNLFDAQEIQLLEEIAGDISFALDLFETEKHRKLAEYEVMRSELRLQQAQSIAHFGNWDLDLITGMAAKWSDEHCRIYGLSTEDNKHSFKSWVSFLHPDDRDFVIKTLKAAETSLTDTAFHHRIVRRDGTLRYIYSYTRYELNSLGNPVALHGVSHDVTEQKEADKKVVIANRLYAFISAVNQTIVHVKDEHTLYDRACRIAIDIGKFGLAWISIPDMANKDLNIVSHCSASGDDSEFLKNMVYDNGGPAADVLLGGKRYIINDFDGETAISDTGKYVIKRGFKSCIVLPIKKSGKTIGTYNLFSARIDSFDQEEIALLEEAAGDISFALDVFEKERHRKQMESEVTHSEIMLKQAQAIAHFGSWELDFATGIADWSQEACRIYGLAPEDNLQSYQAWISFIHPDDLEQVNKANKVSMETLGNFANQHRIIRKDGTVRHVYSQAQFVYNKKGEPTGLHGVDHDITEQKEAEAERTKMIADIVQRNKDLEQFSYIISHNLRAPVANILGIVNIIQTIGLDKEEAEKATDYLASATQNLDNIIRDINHILELKHVVSENKEKVTFSGLLNDVRLSIDNVIREEDVKIISDFSAVDEMITLKSYLHSIFFNLITNSIKYRQPDIAPVIEVRSARLTNKICLIFKDNGLGIDIGKKGDYMFGLYKRFHFHVEGKGIGLYMVKTQVETLGGTISVTSEVNKGTEFRIEFEII